MKALPCLVVGQLDYFAVPIPSEQLCTDRCSQWGAGSPAMKGYRTQDTPWSSGGCYAKSRYAKSRRVPATNQAILVQNGPKRRGRGRQKGNANEFWHAEEATSWARQSKTKNEKQALIELARAWTQAALRSESIEVVKTARRSTGPRKARAGDTRPSRWAAP